MSEPWVAAEGCRRGQRCLDDTPSGGQCGPRRALQMRVRGVDHNVDAIFGNVERQTRSNVLIPFPERYRRGERARRGESGRRRRRGSARGRERYSLVVLYEPNGGEVPPTGRVTSVSRVQRRLRQIGSRKRAGAIVKGKENARTQACAGLCTCHP